MLGFAKYYCFSFSIDIVVTISIRFYQYTRFHLAIRYYLRRRSFVFTVVTLFFLCTFVCLYVRNITENLWMDIDGILRTGRPWCMGNWYWWVFKHSGHFLWFGVSWFVPYTSGDLHDQQGNLTITMKFHIYNGIQATYPIACLTPQFQLWQKLTRNFRSVIY